MRNKASSFLLIFFFSQLVISLFGFLTPRTLAIVDVPTRTVITSKLKLSFAPSGEISVYDRIGLSWREITPKVYGVGSIGLNGSNFNPWNDGTLTYVGASLTSGNALKVSYRQNLTQSGTGYKNWFLVWDTYAKEGAEDTIELWANVRCENGSLTKIDLSYPYLGIGMGNGTETYYYDYANKISYFAGTKHVGGYPTQYPIPLKGYVRESNRTALYVFEFNGSQSRSSYFDAEGNWGTPTWNLNVFHQIRLKQSISFETTRVFLYSDTAWVSGYSTSSSWVKASQWYVRNLQPLLAAPMNLKSIRSKPSNLWINASSSNWKTTFDTYRAYIGTIGLTNLYDNVGDLNPLNQSRVQEITSYAHSYGVSVGILLDIIVPSTSQLYINHPEYFSSASEDYAHLCTAYTPTMRYFYNKIENWAGLGIDWFFINHVQQDDSLDANADHVHDNYYLAYSNLNFTRYLLEAINSNNTDSTQNFVWNDAAGDVYSQYGIVVIGTPASWGRSLENFAVNATRYLYMINSSSHTLEPTWNGLSWDFSNEMQHMFSLATKVYPSWTEWGGSPRIDNILRNMSVFISQHQSLYENYPVVVESVYPFFVVRIGNGIKSIIPVNATSPYSGSIYSSNNNLSISYSVASGGYDFIVVNKDSVSTVSTVLNVGSYSIPISMVANETRLIWLRGQIAITEVRNGYASNVNFSSNTFSLTVNAQTGPVSITDIYVGNKGKPAKVVGATSWSYNESTNILTITKLYSNQETIILDWSTVSPNQGQTTGFTLGSFTEGLIASVIAALAIFAALFVVLIILGSLSGI